MPTYIRPVFNVLAWTVGTLYALPFVLFALNMMVSYATR